LGFLYAFKLIGDGKLFFCPALTSPSSPFSAAHYEPLLTTPDANTGENPFIRTSYLFNPRVVNPTLDLHRKYRKTVTMSPYSIFAVDLMGQGTDANSIPHFRDQGVNVLFTDNSVRFNH